MRPSDTLSTPGKRALSCLIAVCVLAFGLTTLADMPYTDTVGASSAQATHYWPDDPDCYHPNNPSYTKQCPYVDTVSIGALLAAPGFNPHWDNLPTTRTVDVWKVPLGFTYEIKVCKLSDHDGTKTHNDQPCTPRPECPYGINNVPSISIDNWYLCESGSSGWLMCGACPIPIKSGSKKYCFPENASSGNNWVAPCVLLGGNITDEQYANPSRPAWYRFEIGLIQGVNIKLHGANAAYLARIGGFPYSRDDILSYTMCPGHGAYFYRAAILVYIQDTNPGAIAARCRCPRDWASNPIPGISNWFLNSISHVPYHSGYSEPCLYLPTVLAGPDNEIEHVFDATTPGVCAEFPIQGTLTYDYDDRHDAAAIDTWRENQGKVCCPAPVWEADFPNTGAPTQGFWYDAETHWWSELDAYELNRRMRNYNSYTSDTLGPPVATRTATYNAATVADVAVVTFNMQALATRTDYSDWYSHFQQLGEINSTYGRDEPSRSLPDVYPHPGAPPEGTDLTGDITPTTSYTYQKYGRDAFQDVFDKWIPGGTEHDDHPVACRPRLSS